MLFDAFYYFREERENRVIHLVVVVAKNKWQLPADPFVGEPRAAMALEIASTQSLVRLQIAQNSSSIPPPTAATLPPAARNTY